MPDPGAPGGPRVLVEHGDGITRIVLSRPAALNALDRAMATELRDAVAALADDARARVVVVRGAGGNFMAGGDVKWFHAALARPAAEREAEIRAVIDVIHEAIEGLASLPRPVIASVEGACAGFGLSLVAACDLALASREALFSLAYIRIGTSPDGGSTWSLPRIVGLKRAMALALLGERFDAEAAERMGLVNRICAPEALEDETAALARRLAAGPAAALARTKALVRAGGERTLAEQLAAEREAFVRNVVGPEFAEGVRAFVEKRPPRFPG